MNTANLARGPVAGVTITSMDGRPGLQGVPQLLSQARKHPTPPVAGIHGPGPWIVTGHQPWLWHPGIAAKNLLAASLAQACAGQAVHLVVDHDLQPCDQLDMLLHDGDQLLVEPLRLCDQKHDVPNGCQHASAWTDVLARVQRASAREAGRLAVSLEPLLSVLENLSHTDPPASLADAWTRLLWPFLPESTQTLTPVFTSGLMAQPMGRELLAMMLHDVDGCVSAYNQAVASVPEAGIAPLQKHQAMVELPLWQLGQDQPRRRIYARPYSGKVARLCDAKGDQLHEENLWLAPRAMTLTAMVRGWWSDLFIHGKGGGIYDRATEIWWHKWQNKPLGACLIASADVHLHPSNWDGPVSDPEQYRRELWTAHHLPHNPDRYAPADHPLITPLAREKRDALAAMERTSDRAQRQTLFQQIHALNRQMLKSIPELEHRATQGRTHAETALANYQVLGRRDWSLPLYPRPTLDRLAGQIQQQVQDTWQTG